jgi:indole-3-glycerol phosphate synthase
VPSLDWLVSASRRAVEERRDRTPLDELQRAVSLLPPIRPFTEAFSGEEIDFVLRVPAGSPIPELGPGVEVAGLAVDADHRSDDGGIAAVREAAAASPLPVLHRGLVVDAYQLYEARLAGADGVVLITAAFEDDERALAELHATGLDLGLDVILEVGSEEEIDETLERLDPDSFLIRNYDRGGRVDLERTFSLLEHVPAGKVVLSDGGVESREEVLALEQAGVDATILGSWVLETDVDATLSVLRGDSR